MKKILILGVGNYLMADEGLGVHAINRLFKRSPLPEQVDLLDGGTAGFHLLQFIENYPVVILVDATLDQNPPGTIRLLQPKYAADFPTALSAHDIGLKDLVGALQLLGKMPKIFLLAVSIRSIQQQGVELTSEIEAVMPELERLVWELVQQISAE